MNLKKTYIYAISFVGAVLIAGAVFAQNQGLGIKDIKKGTGKEAFNGSHVTVHYTGWLTNGKKFDSSKDRGRPFDFDLGSGQVIKGWDKGVQGMKEGGVRKLTIPPELGYGSRSTGDIPANSTLIFEVELLKVY
ncbi:FKBP-type peptidyl-prolyl cis-trans isomerase [Leptospira wolffii]|uniref:Peptidyl-prolyl cis-trans isomerase n=1 Tax=Leptospira wolffii TaxID=409998 RepID=A0ABV5BLY1_9LEPT|nr:FKBP-type peptidyl-prolyl cis-trans isomerase [Leptospira wolffii]TGL49939.1 FKBP-type peptidyl-prolyl cis-trans isomerase [Leptospira wolffii]